MTVYTRLGTGLWDWEPWLSLDDGSRTGPTAQILWLALYTSAEAKRHAPGLWQGGIAVMAEAAHRPSDDVVLALDRLLARELVEYDPKCRVLRLCELPDPGEFPFNGNHIRSWWTKFKNVTECAVRDAHVRTLRWILDAGARDGHKELTVHHENAWQGTFATVQIPPSRRRGIRRMAEDCDTSTQVQPSLFPKAMDPGSVPVPGYPQDPQLPVDNSAALHQPNKNNNSGSVSDTVSDTNEITDHRSQITNSSSGEGDWGRARPVLALVPPYSAAEVVAELAKGLWDPSFDRTHQNALQALIPVWVAARITLDDFRVLGEYSRHSGATMSARFLVGCDLVMEVERARRVLNWRDVTMANMSESLP